MRSCRLLAPAATKNEAREKRFSYPYKQKVIQEGYGRALAERSFRLYPYPDMEEIWKF